MGSTYSESGPRHSHLERLHYGKKTQALPLDPRVRCSLSAVLGVLCKWRRTAHGPLLAASTQPRASRPVHVVACARASLLLTPNSFHLFGLLVVTTDHPGRLAFSKSACLLFPFQDLAPPKSRRETCDPVPPVGLCGHISQGVRRSGPGWPSGLDDPRDPPSCSRRQVRGGSPKEAPSDPCGVGTALAKPLTHDQIQGCCSRSRSGWFVVQLQVTRTPAVLAGAPQKPTLREHLGARGGVGGDPRAHADGQGRRQGREGATWLV